MLDLISTDAPHLCSNCGNDTKLAQISSCSSSKFERKKPQRNTSGIMVGFLFAYLTMNVALLSERVYLLIICFQKNPQTHFWCKLLSFFLYMMRRHDEMFSMF